jgi:cytochrome c-type biogenesis protein CcmH/NrfG
MTWLVWPLSLGLLFVALAGVLRPFGRDRADRLEKLTDPLEDERQSLLRGLRDLDDEHSTGLLGDADYRSLRVETERRAVTVLRALEARDGAGAFAADLRDLRDLRDQRPDPSPNGHSVRAPVTRRRSFVALTAVGVVVAVTAALLSGALRNRGPGESISGTQVNASPQDALGFLQQRVREHPNDPAAHLDLGQYLLTNGNLGGAIREYETVLRLDPRDAEANAKLGFLLFLGGRSALALQREQIALRTDPQNSEALYFEGLIDLRGLHRPTDAAAAFRSYLAVAPFGAHRTEVERLLTQLAPTPSPS